MYVLKSWATGIAISSNTVCHVRWEIAIHGKGGGPVLLWQTLEGRLWKDWPNQLQTELENALAQNPDAANVRITRFWGKGGGKQQDSSSSR